jgi:uncharacterized membrane protein YgdD (TMEM256/DUF423 family)
MTGDMEIQGDRTERPGSSGVLGAGALLAGLGVLFGAFGAHALRASLDPVALGWWQTGVSYQMWHALALIAIGAGRIERVLLPAWLLGAGTALFSGTLYLMALTGQRWLGAVTPIGGVLMIAGWLLLAWRAWRSRAAS